MRFLLPALLSLGLPLSAIAQSLHGDAAVVPELNGWSSTVSPRQASTALQLATPGLASDPIGVSGLRRGVAQFPLSAHLQMQALSGQRSWAYAGAPTLNESELGLLFSQGRYSLGLNLRSEASAPTGLPRLLPGPVQTGALADLSRGTQVGAVGRLALDRRNSINFGASVGHYDLLPGNSLHVGALEQKSLSLGIEHGPVSGTVVGRVVEPQNGVSVNAYGPEHSWSSIDIGVTLYLPWQGQINVGARNLWSSGQVQSQLPNQSRIDPDQARTPYVQYRQDL